MLGISITMDIINWQDIVKLVNRNVLLAPLHRKQNNPFVTDLTLRCPDHKEQTYIQASPGKLAPFLKKVSQWIIVLRVNYATQLFP